MGALDRLNPAQRHAAILVLGWLYTGFFVGVDYVLKHAVELQIPTWAIPVLSVLSTVGTMFATKANGQYGRGKVEEQPAPEEVDQG